MNNKKITKEDLARMRSVSFNRHGLTRDQIEEFRTGRDAHRAKATTDELGNTVTEHNTKDDQVDVTVRPATVYAKF